MANDEVIRENLFPFYTFGIFLLVGGVRGEAPWKVRKEEGMRPGVVPSPKLTKHRCSWKEKACRLELRQETRGGGGPGTQLC